MRDDMNPFAPSPGPAPAETPAQAETPAAAGDAAGLVAPAVMKFKSCRWRCAPEELRALEALQRSFGSELQG